MQQYPLLSAGLTRTPGQDGLERGWRAGKGLRGLRGLSAILGGFGKGTGDVAWCAVLACWNLG